MCEPCGGTGEYGQERHTLASKFGEIGDTVVDDLSHVVVDLDAVLKSLVRGSADHNDGSVRFDGLAGKRRAASNEEHPVDLPLGEALEVGPLLVLTPIGAADVGVVSKIMPTALKTVFVPFCTIVVMLPITLCALAPLGNFIGEGLGKLLLSVFGQGGIVAVLATAILVAVQPFLVITGMHVVIGMMAVPAFIENGYDNFILLANFVSNWAVWGMALAAAIRLHDKDEKADALSSFVSGFIGGVVEPALYGTGFKYPKAFAGAAAGGFCAGLFAAIMGVREYVLGGGSSALGVVTFVNGDVPSNFAMGVATCVISLIVGTIVAAIFGFNDQEPAK